MTGYVLDTHAFLWHLTGDKRLGAGAKAAFDDIDQDKAKAFIPSIVLAEAIFIIEKKRVTGISFEEIMKRIREATNYIVINLDWQVLERIAEKKEIPEIHDRIIVITAEMFDAKIITKDETIRKVFPETAW